MSASEAQNAINQHGPDIAGIEQLSRYEEITFTKYNRYVLPLDGYVFWITTGETMTQKGSLHYGVDLRQLQEETIAVNKVTFTTGQDIQPFDEIAPNTIWIGATDRIRFAFSSRAPLFHAAGLFHYQGDAIYPTMETQIIDGPGGIDPSTLVVSNSLPAWLQLASYSPVWLVPTNPEILLYPSFLVPDNLPPPYGVVHIEPGRTEALGMTLLDQQGNQYQLAKDEVKITLYGTTNNLAQDWLGVFLNYSKVTNTLGLMNMPVIRDEKASQNELGILAMKKSISIEVSYVQSRMRSVARQLIANAILGQFQQPPYPIFFNDGGLLGLLVSTGYPTSSTGLPPGAVWDNAGIVNVVPGAGTPPTGTPPLYFPGVDARYLLQIGGGSLPTTRPPFVGNGQLWNSSNRIAIA